jgi:hypothetical protein
VNGPSKRELTLAESLYLRELCEVIPRRVNHAGRDSTVRRFVEFVALLEHDGVRTRAMLAVVGMSRQRLARLRREGTPTVKPAPAPPQPPRVFELPAYGEAPSLQAVASTSFVSENIVAVQASTAIIHELAHAMSADASRTARQVVLALGDQNQRRFDLEVAMVRQEIPNALWILYAHDAISLFELRDLLDQYRPTVFHLSAHADKGGVHLVTGEDRQIVAWEWVIDELGKSTH